MLSFKFVVAVTLVSLVTVFAVTDATDCPLVNMAPQPATCTCGGQKTVCQPKTGVKATVSLGADIVISVGTTIVTILASDLAAITASLQVQLTNLLILVLLVGVKVIVQIMPFTSCLYTYLSVTLKLNVLAILSLVLNISIG
ncbi:hypothetical protein V9T40_003017 [Parthenolecanium corni]|uniref:Uncharacterized protein n=1 Tax=Parthenolecanium corni TaxID=536013 RepID=A0AAN9Y7M2_9HEMI